MNFGWDQRKADDELRPEYDLSKLKGGVRGTYAKQFREGTKLDTFKK